MRATDLKSPASPATRGLAEGLQIDSGTGPHQFSSARFPAASHFANRKTRRRRDEIANSKNQTSVLIRSLGRSITDFCRQHEDDVAALPQRPVIWGEHFLAIIALTSQDTVHSLLRIQVRHAGHKDDYNLRFSRSRSLRFVRV
jgi:hypothetical protein